VLEILIKLEFGSVDFEKRGKLEYLQWRKTSYNKGTNQPETHPTYGVNTRIITLGHFAGRRVF